jgi:predicted DNA-binding transcriptional regulator AlpA
MDALLTENQVSENLQVSLACLRRWRLRGEGPQYLKVGPLVRYRPGDIEDWVAGLPTGGNGRRLVVRRKKTNYWRPPHRFHFMKWGHYKC